MLIKDNDDGSYEVLLGFEGQIINDETYITTALLDEMDERYNKEGKPRRFKTEFDHPKDHLETINTDRSTFFSTNHSRVCGIIVEIHVNTLKNGRSILVGTWIPSGPFGSMAEDIVKESKKLKLGMRSVSGGRGMPVRKIVSWDFLHPGNNSITMDDLDTGSVTKLSYWKLNDNGDDKEILFPV